MANLNWWEDSEQLRLFWERLDAIHVDRRHFIKVAGAMGGTAAAALAAAACGSSSTSSSSSGSSASSSSSSSSSSTSSSSSSASSSGSGSSSTASSSSSSSSSSAATPAVDQSNATPQAFATETYNPADMATDQTFNFAAADEPLSFDFNLNLYCLGDAAVWGLLGQFNPLLQVIPDIAESWEPSNNNATWTFHLRPGAVWSNGQPITADDWIYSFTRQLDPASKANYAGFLYDIKNAQAFNTGKAGITAKDLGLSAKDPQTLVVDLEGPRGYFPVLAAYTAAAPAYKPAVEKYGDKWTDPGNIVVTGPYTLSEWNHNQNYTLVKNDKYWNAKSIVVTTVKEPIIDTTAQFAAYQNGEIDLALYGAIGNLPKVNSDPKLKEGYFKYNLQGTWYLQPSVHQKPFDNKQVRLALNHAIDRDTICNQILKGLGTPAYTMINPGMPGYDSNHYDDLTKYDPELALSMLKGTPYEGGKNWPAITITMRNNEGDGPQIVARAIASMLGQNLHMNGIQVQPGDPTTTYQKMYQHKIQLMWIRWYIDYPDPNDDMYLVWYSHLGSGQRSDWSNAQFDSLIQQAAALPNGDPRWNLYHQADKIMLEDGAATFVYNPYNYMLKRPWVTGLPKDQDGNLVPAWNVFVRMYDYVRILKH